MKFYLKSSLIFLCTLLITSILSAIIFEYNLFNLRWQFQNYKWVIPCFITASFITYNIVSHIRAIVTSLVSILTYYILELTYQYFFSGIIIDYVYPITLWQMKKSKLMLFLKYELQPWPWFLAGFLGCICCIIYKYFRNKKYQERNLHV